MKTFPAHSNPCRTAGLAIFCLASCVMISAAQSGEKPVMRDAATHEQLSALLRKASQQDPMKSFKPITGEDPSLNRPKDLISRSEVLCFNGLATLVPKRAVIQIPKNFADRMQFKPGARIKPWTEFYTLNRGWITTFEVSRLQAEGKDPIAEKNQLQMAKGGNLVVATYRGNPVSVLPLKIPAQAATGTNLQPSRP